MESWLAASPRRSLWVYFHEVYASAPPWRRTFWISRRQRRLASRLVRMSSLSLTSLPLYEQLLRRLGARGRILVRAIPSSVGEIEVPPPFAERGAQLAVFGSAGVRARAYRSSDLIAAACRVLAIADVLDLGPGDVAPSTCGDYPVRALGELSTEDVSRNLRRIRAGFLAYPLDFLGKSSVFAAYAAHGLLPICCGRAATRTEAPAAGIHYWDVGGPGTTPAAPGGIAAAAHAWYGGHDLRSLAALLLRELASA
jgi:hypothetical protein